MSDFRFAVVGPGGVGGYFGARLTAAGGDVRFLGHGRHCAAARERGLIVLTGGTTLSVPGSLFFDDPAQIGPVDIVLFTVKSYDTETAARRLGPMLRDDSVVVSLQNGIDNEDRIASAIPRGTVFGGVAYVYATITEPGTVTEWGGPKKIVFGPRSPGPDLRSLGVELHRQIAAGGIDAEYTDDIVTALWSKFIFISAVGGVTALTRLTLGELLAVPASRDLLHAAMEEGVAVAHAAGIGVAEGYIDDAFRRLEKYDNATRSSLYADLAGGKRLEIEALSGAVERLGTRYGVNTPIHRTIYACLLPYHRAALSRAAAEPSP